MTRCPVCRKPLEVAPGIGPVCLTFECPVIDDANNWKSKSAIKEGRRQMKFNKEYPE